METMNNSGIEKKDKIITKKRVKIAIIILGLLLIGAFAFVSYQIGTSIADGLVFYNKGNDTKGNSIKQLEAWGYNIEGFEKQFKGEKIEVIAEDGNKVPAILFTADKSKDNHTVILVHGLGGDYASVYPQAEMYLKNGWNVVALDQRGGGDSAVDIITFGYHEKLDIKALVDYVKVNTKDKKIVVHGFSMGAVTAGIYAGTEHANRNINGVILDSAFDSMEGILLSSWDDMKIDLPKEYAIWCGNLGLHINYGFGFDDANAISALKNCDIPALVIQGEKDEVSTIEMGEAIFDSIKGNKKEYWLVNTKHIEAYIDYPLQYKERVMNFIN